MMETMDTKQSLSDLSGFADKARSKRKKANPENKEVENLQNSGQQILSVHWSEVYSVAQVRKRFRKIESLAESLQLHGQDHPIRVHPKDKYGYKIRKGERRWRACKMNDGTVDIIIDDRDPEDEVKELIGQIVENTQRDDLTPMELADAFGTLRDKGLKQKEIAKQAGYAESAISKYLSLLNSPQVIVDLMEAEVTSDLELVTLLRKVHDLDPERCEQMCAAALEGGITRSYAQGILRGIKHEKSAQDRQDANPQSGSPKLDNPGAVAEQEHQNELNESGLNETGLELPPEEDPEPNKTSAKAPSPQDPHQKQEGALLNKDGFYERRPEDAVILCEVNHDGDKRTGVIQLHLLADEDNEMVVRMTDSEGNEELAAFPAEKIKLLGYKQ